MQSTSGFRPVGAGKLTNLPQAGARSLSDDSLSSRLRALRAAKLESPDVPDLVPRPILVQDRIEAKESRSQG